MKKSYFNKLVKSIAIVVIFASCKDYDPAVSVSDSAKNFSASEILDLKGYSVFNDAVTHAGIAGELFPGDSMTVFAPSNAAFSAYLSKLGLANITDVDATTLANVLRYHTIGGAVIAADLSESTATLVTGKMLYRSNDDGLNGRAGFNGDVMYSSDGIINGITAVLDIPADDIMSILNASPNHTDLVTELVRTGLDVTLSGASNFTLLAPDNAAMAGVAALSVTEATDVLNFHVFANRIHTVEFVDGRNVSALGTTASDNVQEVTVAEGTFNGISPDSANYLADNGVVHFVSSTIDPENDIDGWVNNSDHWRDLWEAVGAEDSYLNLDTTYSIFGARLSTLTVASFPDNDSIQGWLDAYTFAGSVDFRDLASGDKITSGGDRSYYMQNLENGTTTINGQATVFTGQTLSAYNGYFNFSLDAAYPIPVPDSTISEVLNGSAKYTLIGKAIEVAGKTEQVDAQGTTFYAIHDTTFFEVFGYNSIAVGLDTLSLTDENDEDIIADIIDMIDAHTVSAVESSFIIANDLPAQTSAADEADEDIVWGVVDANTVIITDVTDPQNNFITPDVFNRWAINGVIHVLDDTLD